MAIDSMLRKASQSMEEWLKYRDRILGKWLHGQ